MLGKLIGSMMTMSAALTLMQGTGLPERSRAEAAAPTWQPPLPLTVQSRDGRYLATLSFDRATQVGTLDGWLRVTTPEGRVVNRLELVLMAALPADTDVVVPTPRMTAAIGEGRYRIRGITIDRPGVWQVRVVAHARVGSDAFVFQLVR